MAGLRGVKGTVYENGIRVPFYARWPAGGIEGPRALDRIAAHVDLLPTILDAVRLPAPGNVRLDGTSLLPLLSGTRSEADWPARTLFFQWDARLTPEPFQAFAVITQQYKLVQARGIDARHDEIWADYENVSAWNGRPGETITGPARYELFDLERDPGERQDLSAHEPERVEDMKREYEAWFREVFPGARSDL
jgi:arylsulfatase A-like enzyme